MPRAPIALGSLLSLLAAAVGWTVFCDEDAPHVVAVSPAPPSPRRALAFAPRAIASSLRVPAPVPLETARAVEKTALPLTAQRWAARDFPAAYRWAVAVDDPALRSSVLAAVLLESGRSAPQATLELAQAAPLGDFRETVLQQLAVQWTADDPAAAEDWAMSQPATPSRDGIFQKIALARLTDNPAVSAHLIRFAISPGPAQEDTLIQALDRWPAADLPRAAAWLQRFPETLRRRVEDELHAASVAAR